MVVVRNTFTAKPGQSSTPITQMKAIAAARNLRNARVFTDLTGDVNQVVMEYEVESLAGFEALMQRYATDPQIRAQAKGYTDYWMTRKRELFGARDLPVQCPVT
jgi:hypothetical protein